MASRTITSEKYESLLVALWRWAFDAGAGWMEHHTLWPRSQLVRTPLRDRVDEKIEKCMLLSTPSTLQRPCMDAGEASFREVKWRSKMTEPKVPDNLVLEQSCLEA
jgi:hypothetical protein